MNCMNWARVSGRLLLSMSAISCGSSVLDGADAVPAQEVPSGRVLAVLSPSDCVDGQGKPVVRPATTIRVLLREDGTPLLVEERPGYDSLVVHNSFEAKGVRVFQALSTPDEAEPALHEYRIDWPAAEGGRLATARSFDVTVQVGGSFRARASKLSLSCKLLSTEAPRRLDNPAPVRYEESAPRASG